MKIIGHQKQWALLKNAFRNNSVSHAYLFSGPAQVGKKTLALEFIKLINCQHSDLGKRPCDACLSCRMIDRMNHPDFIFLAPEETKSEIQISQVRALIERLSRKPFLAHYKAGLIDEAHLMNAYAQNCILKTLEEPKGNAVLILVTHHREVLLPTILSRLQEIKFSLVNEKEITDFLSQRQINEKQLKRICQLSSARPGQALELLEKPYCLEQEDKLEREFGEIMRADLETRFKKAEDLAKNYSPQTLESWLRYLRNLLLKSIEGGNTNLTRIKQSIVALEKTIFLISNFNVNKRLALENLMLKL